MSSRKSGPFNSDGHEMRITRRSNQYPRRDLRPRATRAKRRRLCSDQVSVCANCGKNYFPPTGRVHPSSFELVGSSVCRPCWHNELKRLRDLDLDAD